MLRPEPAIPHLTATPAAFTGGSRAAAAIRAGTPDIAEAGQRVMYRHGEEIFAEGDPAVEIFSLVSGCIRLVKLLSDGRRQICAFIMPGQLVGLSAASEQAFSAEAIGVCVAVRYRRDAIETRIGADPAFASAMRAAAALDLQNAYDRMVLVCRRPAAARVAWFLLTMRKHAPGDTFRLPMSRSDIADYLGMALETASRAFTELKKRKAIAQANSAIVTLLDRALAVRIADAA